MISPLSKGLFHKAISQSGNLMNPWADPAPKGLAKMRAVRLADSMGCSISGTSMKEMVKCLREVPAEKITLAVLQFQVRYFYHKN
jgi:carboxylesterase type B